MIVTKTYRNHRTGVEKLLHIEKPDDTLIMGCANVVTIDHNHGDIIEEATSPNVITDYVKDQLGRMVFNGIAAGAGSIPGGRMGITLLGAVIKSGFGNCGCYVNLSPSTQGGADGGFATLYWPFNNICLTDYNVAESASEKYLAGSIVSYMPVYDDTSTGGASSFSLDGNTLTLAYDWSLASFSGTFYSIAWTYSNVALSAQGARTLLASPVTKTSTQSLRVTYTFTYTP